MEVKAEDVNNKVVKILGKSFGKAKAKRIAEVLMWSEMCGIKTQGLVKLTGAVPLQNVKPTGKITITKKGRNSSVINGYNNSGALVAQVGVDLAIKRAKKAGIYAVGINGYNTSTGTLSFYANRIADAGFIGVVMARSIASVAPFESIDPLFGTNPMCYAFPTKDKPLIFDMATSALTWYGLVRAKMLNEKIPRGVAIDKNGNITEEPVEALEGALLPFDKGYKGSGLGMVVEIFAGILAGGRFSDTEPENSASLFILAIDPSVLVDASEFRSKCSEMIKRIKSARTKSGNNAIRLPGERAHEAYERCIKTGVVDIDEATLRAIGFIK